MRAIGFFASTAAALLAVTAINAAEPVRYLYFLADGNLRLDDGPELDESHLQAEIVGMCAGVQTLEIRLQPMPKTTFEQVGRVLVDLRAAGCVRLGFVGYEQAE